MNVDKGKNFFCYKINILTVIAIIVLFIINYFYNPDVELYEFIEKSVLIQTLSIDRSSLLHFIKYISGIVWVITFFSFIILDYIFLFQYNKRKTNSTNINNIKIINVFKLDKKDLLANICMMLISTMVVLLFATNKILSIFLLYIWFIYLTYWMLRKYYLLNKTPSYNRKTRLYIVYILLGTFFLFDILLPLPMSSININKLNDFKDYGVILGYLGINIFNIFTSYKNITELGNSIKEGFWGFNRNDLLIALDPKIITVSNRIMNDLSSFLVLLILLLISMRKMYIFTTGIIFILLLYEKDRNKSYEYTIDIDQEKIKSVNKIYDDYYEKIKSSDSKVTGNINPFRQLFYYANNCLKNNTDILEMNKAMDFACRSLYNNIYDLDKKDAEVILEIIFYDTYYSCEGLKNIDEVLSLFFTRLSIVFKQETSKINKNSENYIKITEKYNYFVYIFIKLIVFQIGSINFNRVEQIVLNIYKLDLFENIKFLNLFLGTLVQYTYKDNQFKKNQSLSDTIKENVERFKRMFKVVDVIDVDPEAYQYMRKDLVKMGFNVMRINDLINDKEIEKTVEILFANILIK